MKQDENRVSIISKTYVLSSIISGFKQMFVIDESKDNVISESTDFVVAGAGAGPELVLSSLITKTKVLS